MSNLSKETEKQISDRGEKLTENLKTDNPFNTGYVQGFIDGHESGATEYANQLHQAQQEFGRVSTMFLDLDTKHEQARALLQKFISRHEAGLLPDRFIYDEIKTFLDGK
jgi:hypothetical protein